MALGRVRAVCPVWSLALGFWGEDVEFWIMCVASGNKI